MGAGSQEVDPRGHTCGEGEMTWSSLIAAILFLASFSLGILLPQRPLSILFLSVSLSLSFSLSASLSSSRTHLQLQACHLPVADLGKAPDLSSPSWAEAQIAQSLWHSGGKCDI